MCMMSPRLDKGLWVGEIECAVVLAFLSQKARTHSRPLGGVKVSALLPLAQGGRDFSCCLNDVFCSPSMPGQVASGDRCTRESASI